MNFVRVHSSFFFGIIKIIFFNEVQLTTFTFGGASEAVWTEFLGFERFHAVVFALWSEVGAVLWNQWCPDPAFWRIHHLYGLV